MSRVFLKLSCDRDIAMLEFLRRWKVATTAELATRFHGDRPSNGLRQYIEGLETVTEQELRRLHPDSHPNWIPKSTYRRPDGYWRSETRGGARVIALEVELIAKSGSSYNEIGWFYDYQDGIHEDLWVVLKPSEGERIHDTLNRASHQGSKHSFVLLESFYRSGWQATCYIGQSQQKSIAEILGKSVGECGERFPNTFLLDARKAPQFSKTCELYCPYDFSDRLPRIFKSVPSNLMKDGNI